MADNWLQFESLFCSPFDPKPILRGVTFHQVFFQIYERGHQGPLLTAVLKTI